MISAGGNDWLGANVNALVSGDDLVDSGGSHITAGTMSRRLGDLLAQEAAMDPDIAAGQRKYITEVDLAFLRDIGWQTVAIPEPSSAFAVVGVSVGVLLCRRRAA